MDADLRRREPHRQSYTWTEQHCKDAAIMTGLTEEEGLLYYLRYATRGWVDGASVPIADIRAHMRLLKITGGLPKPQQATKRLKTLLAMPGKRCGKKVKYTRKDGKQGERYCGMPAVWMSEGDYPIPHCVECIPDDMKGRMRKQGYDVP